VYCPLFLGGAGGWRGGGAGQVGGGGGDGGVGGWAMGGAGGWWVRILYPPPLIVVDVSIASSPKAHGHQVGKHRSTSHDASASCVVRSRLYAEEVWRTDRHRWFACAPDAAIDERPIRGASWLNSFQTAIPSSPTRREQDLPPFPLDQFANRAHGGVGCRIGGAMTIQSSLSANLLWADRFVPRGLKATDPSSPPATV